MALNIDDEIFVKSRDVNKYFWVKYYVESISKLRQAAKEIAIGQSFGNPNMRSVHETPKMVEDHLAVILESPTLEVTAGEIWIGYPYANIDFDRDGISQFLCMTMGGQMDIDNILKCHMLDFEFYPLRNNHPFPPSGIETHYFHKPRYGITGMRNIVRSFRKPLFGGIIKPKTGITPDQLLEMVKELVDGGVDFIKEDEILGNPEICPLDRRVDKISNWLNQNNHSVVYTYCINGDPVSAIDKCRTVYAHGGRGVHLNFWSGLGTYHDIRKLKEPLFIHYQKSGDKILTSKKNAYRIDWNVMCKLATLSGVDTIHAGMIGGYSDYTDEEMLPVIKTLRDGNVVPALSCGMTAELIQPIVDKIGVDFMANVGGAIHSDPAGTTAGAMKIRRAIDNIRV